MAHWRGVMWGSKGETSRLGTKDSGLSAILSGWNGEVRVTLHVDEAGYDCYVVEQRCLTAKEAPKWAVGKWRLVQESTRLNETPMPPFDLEEWHEGE